MPFIPHTDADIQAMLKQIAASSIEDLFDEIPEALKSIDFSPIPSGATELELKQELSAKSEQDSGLTCFAGGGAYWHHIPAAVWQVATRGEFYTAYTPYQAEASQGTLQLLYEYQSMMAELTGMAVSNASLYDGASALAEAVLMAIRSNKKAKSKTVLIPEGLNPAYLKTVENIVAGQGVILKTMPLDKQTGLIDKSKLENLTAEPIAAVVLTQPNYYGLLDTVDELCDWVHTQSALCIAVVNPVSLALFSPPGKWGETGVDIVCGEGQPLGIPLSSGGPYFGFLCCTQPIVRQMPGRIIGKTEDADGNAGYTLTLQAREQHIRRSKATSNICTNQGLMVTAATIFMSIMGGKGLQSVAKNAYHNAHSLYQKCIEIEGVTPAYKESLFFHEFVVHFNCDVQGVYDAMVEKGFLPGIILDEKASGHKNALLLCATEMNTAASINAFVTALTEVVKKKCGVNNVVNF